jgi:hypothetical protein
MKRMMMMVVAAVVCLTMSAEKNVVMPTMGCEEQTVVKMLGTPAEVNADGDEVVYHDLMFRGTRWDCIVVKYKQAGKLKMMKGLTLTESCRNAQEAYDFNAGLQQLLRRDYGWLDNNADGDSWMTYQGGEALDDAHRYAFTLSTKKEDKTNIVSLALY